MALDGIELLCPRCSAPVRIEAPAGAAGHARCPRCDLAFSFRLETPAAAIGSTAAIRLGAETAGGSGPGVYGTDFHPKSLFDGAALGGAEEAPEIEGDATVELPAEVPAGAEDAAGWRRPPARAAWLLRLGAGPGSARLAIPWARTVVGRRDADLRLTDVSVSARHFAIESIGGEFFVRDLGSRNGTWLNGHRIRYAELRPGDALRAGTTELVFRAAGDGIERDGAGG